MTMSVESDQGRVSDILEAALEVLELTQGGQREALHEDRHSTLLGAYLFAAMGEAAAHISPSFRDAHPEVPWGKLAEIRQRLPYADYDTDATIIWDTAFDQLPELIPVLERLVAEGA